MKRVVRPKPRKTKVRRERGIEHYKHCQFHSNQRQLHRQRQRGPKQSRPHTALADNGQNKKQQIELSRLGPPTWTEKQSAKSGGSRKVSSKLSKSRQRKCGALGFQVRIGSTALGHANQTLQNAS